MKITLPNQNWLQVNKGDNLGSLYASWNLDLLSEPGKIKTSPQTTSYVVSDGTASNAFVSFGTEYALCGTKINYWTGTEWAWHGSLVPTNQPTCNTYLSDMVVFNNKLIVSYYDSTFAYLAMLTGTTWTPTWVAPAMSGANIPHPLCVSYNNLLLIGNNRNIVSINTSDDEDTTAVVLPFGYIIEWIKSSSKGIWIGTKNSEQDEAKVFFWDGYSENYNAGYRVSSEYCFAGVIDKQDVPYVINGYGQLMRFNGSGFEEVARLPVANSKKYGLTGYINSDDYPPVHRNGMAIIDDKVHILLNAGLDGTDTKLLENQLSGIWCYTPENGLHHRFSLNRNITSTVVDYGYPQLASVGALVQLPKRLGSFYAGAVVSSGSIIASLDTTDTEKDKIGCFITPNFDAQEIEEMWNSITLLHKELSRPEDYIRVKYRFTKKYDDSASQTVVTGTWTRSNTFTVTSIGDLEVGDEIEILRGRGAGLSSKITDITGTTITIEDYTPAAESTFTFRSERWIDIDTIQDIVSRYNRLGIDKNNTQIQFKVILFGKGDSPEIDKLIINSGIQIK